MLAPVELRGVSSFFCTDRMHWRDGPAMDDKTAQQAKTLANFVWQIAEILRGEIC